MKLNSITKYITLSNLNFSVFWYFGLYYFKFFYKYFFFIFKNIFTINDFVGIINLTKHIWYKYSKLILVFNFVKYFLILSKYFFFLFFFHLFRITYNNNNWLFYSFLYNYYCIDITNLIFFFYFDSIFFYFDSIFFYFIYFYFFEINFSILFFFI